MKTTAIVAVAVAVLSKPLGAQEPKPVPKNSVRVAIPGCAKGYMFTVGPRTEEHPGTVDISAGTHLRMTGPKQMVTEIDAQRGMIELTGLMRKGQYDPNGLSIGGVHITPGQAPMDGSRPGSPIAGQIVINVEGWSPVGGDCPSR